MHSALLLRVLKRLLMTSPIQVALKNAKFNSHIFKSFISMVFYLPGQIYPVQHDDRAALQVVAYPLF